MFEVYMLFHHYIFTVSNYMFLFICIYKFYKYFILYFVLIILKLMDPWNE